MRNLKSLSLYSSIVFILGFAAFGCTKKDDATKSDSTSPNTAAPQAPAVATVGRSGAGDTGLPIEQVPAELKTEGYEYYGLSHGAPIEFEVLMPNGTTPETGSAVTKLTAVKDGVATFITERTGPLESLGAE